MEELQKIEVKVFVKKGEDIPAYDFMTVFQRWIQKHTVPGVLIDVADYSHMHHGPGVVLVAHEHNISIDYAEGRMGLQFRQKQPIDGSLQDRLRLCIKYALMACAELVSEPELEGRLEFDGSNLLIIANDRLQAPPDKATAAQFQGQVYEVVERLFDSKVDYEIRQDDPRDRIAVEIRAAEEHSIMTLISNCSAQEVG